MTCQVVKIFFPPLLLSIAWRLWKIEQASPGCKSFNLSTSFIFYFCSHRFYFPILWPLKYSQVVSWSPGVGESSGPFRIFRDSFLKPPLVHVMACSRRWSNALIYKEEDPLLVFFEMWAKDCYPAYVLVIAPVLGSKKFFAKLCLSFWNCKRTQW